MRYLFVALTFCTLHLLHAQGLNVEFKSVEQGRVSLFLTPLYNIYKGKTHFLLQIDSLRPAAGQFWLVRFWLHLKTTDTTAYAHVSIVYPLVKVWDTVIDGQLICFDVQPIEASILSRDSTLLSEIIFLRQSVRRFPGCMDSDTLRILRGIFAGLGRLNQVNPQLRQCLSVVFVDLGLELYQKDCPSSALWFMHKALALDSTNQRAKVYLRNAFRLGASEKQRIEQQLINKSEPAGFSVFFNRQELYSRHLDSFCRAISLTDTLQALKHLQTLFSLRERYDLDSAKTQFYSRLTELMPEQILLSIRLLVMVQEFDLALRLLDFLYQQDIPSIATRQEQQFLGYHLALRDFVKNPWSRRLKLLRSYTKKRFLWYRYLVVKYLQQRSKMKPFRY